LASNSLLEGMVFSYHAARKVVRKRTRQFGSVVIPEWDETGAVNDYEWVLVKHNLKEIQSVMWDYVGIVRSSEKLNKAFRRLSVIYDEVENYYKKSKVTKEVIELRNLTTVAYLITKAALRRKESRGAHYMSDFPYSLDKYLKDTII